MRLLSFSLFIRDGNKGKFILKLLEGKIYIYPKLGLSIHPTNPAHPAHPTRRVLGGLNGCLDQVRVQYSGLPWVQVRLDPTDLKKKHTHTHTTNVSDKRNYG